MSESKYAPDDSEKDVVSGVSAPVDVDSIEVNVINPHRGLRMRHVQLIAVSGSIGSALFVSIGNPLTEAGPLGLLIGVAIWCIVVWASANCLVEMSTLLPVDGGFINLAARFVDEAFGMALGWNYAITQWALVCFELTAINVIAEYWTMSLNPAILISASLVVVGSLNMVSVRWYGEAEFWFSIAKLFLMLGLTIYTFITMVGGNPLHDVYGFRFWKEPGPFAGVTNFKDVLTAIFDTVSWATFAVVGPDYMSIISGEVANPRRVMPRAFNSTMFRIVAFYMTGALCVGIVASSDDQNLLGAIAAGAPGAAKSPYVISMNRLNIPVLPSLVNAVILISILSTTNSFVYVGSRALYGLAERHHAPGIFRRVNRFGVPYLCVAITLALACLSYLSVSSGAVKVLNWWIDLVTCAQLVTWSCIALTYLRFRQGLKVQSLFHILPVRGWFQPLSGYWLLVWSSVVLFFSGYYCFLPGAFSATDFVFAYGSVFIFLAILIGAKAYNVFIKKGRLGWIPAGELDFVSDIQGFEDMTVAYEAQRAAAPQTVAHKVSQFFFRE